MRGSTHQATSHEAKKFIRSADRSRVYQLLTRFPRGPTDEDIQACLDLPSHTECPRRIELVRDGAVIDSGKRRKTSSGRYAIVWVARERGAQ